MDFQKKDWQFRDIISENELNRMEDGIEEGITKAEQAQGDISAHVTRTDNPHGVTKDQVGLGNVDNVQQIPMSQKGQPNGVATLDDIGKVPSSQLPDIVAPVTSVNGKTGDVQLTASDVGAPTTQQHDQLEQKIDAHLADNTIHKTSDVIRAETGTKLKVEVVSSSESESPEQGRIVFDVSQGKFFGGNGSGWV